MHQSISSSIVLLSCLLGTNVLADEIKLFTWEDYFSPDVIHQFEVQSGHTVNQIYFESEMLRDTVVHSGKAAAYDLFILDSHALGEFSKRGLLSNTDAVMANTAQYFSPDAKQACGQYGVPYAYGTIGIGYRSSKVKMKFTSWMDVFEYAQQSPGKLVIPDEDIDTIAIALMALGYDPLTSNESELREAYQLLSRTFGNLLALRNSAGYALESKHNSKMDVAVFYSGEKESISNATGQDDWEYVIPNEGTLIWYECLSSHTDNPMSKAAIEFVEFINRPDIAAKNAEDIWFATTNRAALSLASDEYRSDSELFPVGLSEKKTFHYKGIDDASLRLRAHILSVLLER